MPRNTQNDDNLLLLNSLNASIDENEHAPSAGGLNDRNLLTSIASVSSDEDRRSARYSQETDEFDSEFPQLRRHKPSGRYVEAIIESSSSSNQGVIISRQSMPPSMSEIHRPLDHLRENPPFLQASPINSKPQQHVYKILHTQSHRNSKLPERVRREITERDKKPLDLDLDAAAHVANLGGGGLINGSTSPLLLERGPGAPDFDTEPAALLGEWGVGIPGVGIIRRATIAGSNITATAARNRRMHYFPHVRRKLQKEIVESANSMAASANSRSDENGVMLRKLSWRNVPQRDSNIPSAAVDLDASSEVLYNSWMRRCCPSDRANHHEKIRKMLETVLPSKFNKRSGADRPEIPKQELEENLWKDLRAKLLNVSLERHRELLVKQRSDNEPLKKVLLNFTIDPHLSDDIRLAPNMEYVITDQYIKHLIVSRNRVEALLDRVDRLQEAYCNSFHLLCYDSDWCEGGELDEKLRCLRLWLNLLNRLCAALDSVEKELRLSHGALQPLAMLDKNSQQPNVKNLEVDGKPISLDQTQVAAIALNRISRVTFHLEETDCEEINTKCDFAVASHNEVQNAAEVVSQHNPHHLDHKSSVYHEYLDRQLRKNKLRVVLQRLHDLVHMTLVTCQLPLRLACCGKLAGFGTAAADERSSSHVRNSNVVTKEIVIHRTMVSPPALLELPLLANEDEENYFNEQNAELELYGAAFSQFKAMRLPSLLPLFVKVAHVLLDVMRECMDMQCKTRDDKSGRRLEPLSLMCNIVEFREVLKYAIVVRRYFTEMVCGVLCTECNPKAKESLDKLTANEDMESYDVAVSQTMELFFHDVGEYLELFTNLVEPQRDQALLLENEWRNIKNLLVFFPDGQHDAIKRFCMLTTRILNSLREFLDSTVESVRDKFSDDSCTCWQDSGDEEPKESSTTSSSCCAADSNCTTSNNLTTTASSSFQLDSEVASSAKQDCRKMGAPVSTMSYRLKATFYTARDGMMQAIGVARLLLREFEQFSAFRLAQPSSLPKLFDALRSKHVFLKLATPSNPSLVYFAPVELASHLELIRNLLQPNFFRVPYYNQNTQPYYLLLVSMESIDESLIASEANRLWRGGPVVEMDLNADNHIALSHLEIAPGGLLLLAQDSSDLEQQRKFFARNLWHGSSDRSGVFNLVHLVKEQCCGHDEISEKLSDLKEAALALTTCLHDNIKKSVEKADLVQELSQADTLAEKYRKTLYKCFSVGFDYHRELSRLFSDSVSQKCLAEPVRHFALLWLHFVKNWCPAGFGVVPPWCEPGLLFLQDLALHPQYAEFYSNSVWNELLECSNESICHVVGTPSDRSPIPSMRSIPELRPFRADQGNTLSMSLDIEDLLETRNQRIADKLKQLEMEQEEKRNECSIAQRLGRVIETPREGHTQLKDVPRVSFNWTRVKRLGSGTFGQVFLVKTNNQRMMAMKVMPRQHLGQGFTSSMRQLAEETKLFTSLNHDNLVRYYGVQVLQDDMSIFMEYCKGGTLQSAARTGLDRMLIQQYTREVLQGLCLLHERGIVHRDVKPANVFLTGEKTPPLLKLGDFGSFAKLQVVGGLSRRTINRSPYDTPGGGPTGTERYMAPEIIREENPVQCASDIWSAGCLVWELFTGKAPWASFGSDIQVIMLVGDFTKAEDSQRIRNALPEESFTGPFGYDFMCQCLRVNPSERPTAAELVKHPFCKVLGDGESVSAF